MMMRLNRVSGSWPGLPPPPTSVIQNHCAKDVDALRKAGHEGEFVHPGLSEL